MSDEPGKGEEGGGEVEDEVFLKKIESSMLTQVKLQGIEGIRKVRAGAAGGIGGLGGRGWCFRRQHGQRCFSWGRVLPRSKCAPM